jgi:hypothetical protein
VYSTCLSCGSRLGRNSILEQFPVGRRLAFDTHKGRLWVLCSSCRAWNLAPLEERWEAVESAERLFERAAIGSSTENVALGRVADGTELLRVGRVNRPELAAWRYGDRLLGRWKRYRTEMLVMVGTGVALGGAPIIPVLTGMTALAGIQIMRGQRPFMHTEAGEPVCKNDAFKALLLPTAGLEGWSLSLPRRGRDSLELTGREALRALRGLFPTINRKGGRPEQVRNSVDEIERLGSAEEVLRESAVELARMENLSRKFQWPLAVPGMISKGHPVIQLVLEMAANEEAERRALEGELSVLEQEWREAEEIAAISDDLLLPHALHARIQGWKEGKDQ